MKKPDSVFSQLQAFENEINRLEGRVLELEQKMEQLIQIERNHLIRVKNDEELSDDFIYQGRRYHDLSPDRAWKLYQNKDYDYIILDVSHSEYMGPRLPRAIRIPWEQFHQRFIEIQSRITPILVICEDGTSSVLACEFLSKMGFYNCNNVSGGYKFWKGFRFSNVSSESA